jgi:alkyl sulfatase BDS1-like metallo-beta-lactamase superfamily hydrolase
MMPPGDFTMPRRFVLPLLFLGLAGLCAAQTNEEKLIAHSDEFRPEIIKVTEGVWVAVGYALANSVLIEGADGVIIVDTTESKAAARVVKAEFDKLTKKPVKAIIYTHNHYDHINGSEVFAGDARPEVYAQELLEMLVVQSNAEVGAAMQPRNLRQFGTLLPDDARPNAGIGPKLVLDPGGALSYVKPTKTFDDQLEFTAAGLRVKLVHAPGETDDQLYVWLPEKKVLCVGDNYYLAFPNLYAIRGTPYRDVRKWRDSVDLVISENPEFLVPSHSRPLAGAGRIREVLTDYRNAIDSVYTQTIAGMNRGLTPDQLVQEVKLPEALASKPYLQQFYGTVPWAVRSIFAGMLGWFDGNPTNLFPLAPKDRAERIAALAGGKDALLQGLRDAEKAGDHQWAAELADTVLAYDPASAEAKSIKAQALIALGRQQISANARNYFMTSAMQLGATPPKYK